MKDEATDKKISIFKIQSEIRKIPKIDIKKMR